MRRTGKYQSRLYNICIYHYYGIPIKLIVIERVVVKTKKTYILSLLLVIVLICSCVSCTNRKNARKNLLTEIKNICEQKLNTIDYYNFAAEDFVLDDEVCGLS